MILPPLHYSSLLSRLLPAWVMSASCSAEMRLTFYSLRQSGHWLAGSDAQTCRCVSVLHLSPIGSFGLKHTHSPVATLSGWSSKPGAQPFLVTFIGSPLSGFISASTMWWTAHSIPDSYWGFPCISHSHKSSPAPTHTLFLPKYSSTFSLLPFHIGSTRNHSPAVRRGWFSDSAIYLGARNSDSLYV